MYSSHCSTATGWLSNRYSEINPNSVLWFITTNTTQMWLVFDHMKISYKCQKQTSRGVLRKWCSENMRQIYRRTLMPKCDSNKVAKQLYGNRTSTWVFSCKICCTFSEHLYLRTPLDGCFWTNFQRVSWFAWGIFSFALSCC